jgi:hypothetical protein
MYKCNIERRGQGQVDSSCNQLRPWVGANGTHNMLSSHSCSDFAAQTMAGVTRNRYHMTETTFPRLCNIAVVVAEKRSAGPTKMMFKVNERLVDRRRWSTWLFEHGTTLMLCILYGSCPFPTFVHPGPLAANRAVVDARSHNASCC